MQRDVNIAIRWVGLMHGLVAHSFERVVILLVEGILEGDIRSVGVGATVALVVPYWAGRALA